MKKLIYTICICALFFSCAKDKGNYQYVDVPPILLEDSDITGKVFVKQGEKLKLSPAINLNGNTDDLSYEWFVYLNSYSASYVQDSTLIARTKSLDYVVDGSIFTIGEDYKLTYKVTNNKTGISNFYFYQLTVSDIFTTGWMFLENKNNVADLSMILRDGTVYRNIYTDRNPDHQITNPQSFTISSRSVSDAVGPDGKKYYVVGAQDAVELDGTTMRKRFDYDYIFFTPPATIKPSFIAWGGSDGNTVGLLINDGNLHTNLVGGFPGAKKFGAQLRSPDHQYSYNFAADFIAGTGYSDTYNLIMYDKLNKQFYDVAYNALRNFDPAAIDPNIFDMNNVGLDLIKLDSSNTTAVRNAVMKDNTGKGFLLQFRMNRTSEFPIMTINKQRINAPGIGTVTDVTCSTLSPHLFYLADGKLYRYEVTSDTYSEEYVLPAGETLTKIKFDKHGYGNAQPRLIVCTWNGTDGKVYYFKLSPTGAVDQLDKVVAGFGKIIDLAFKY